PVVVYGWSDVPAEMAAAMRLSSGRLVATGAAAAIAAAIALSLGRALGREPTAAATALSLGPPSKRTAG
ncbi:MAG TPA: hypothetical protein VNA28_02835, partial [Solirubrobacteraceae bacterium]|nr:hypothetical protein [Solirubrobacteraceae bacterium]